MPQVAPEDALALARPHAEGADSAVAFNDGVNTVFCVEDAGSPACVVKFGTCDPEGVRAEPVVLRLLAGAAPVPRVFDAGERGGVPYFVADHLDGEQPPYPVKMDASRLRPLARRVGRLLARVHGPSVDGVGRLHGGGDAPLGEARASDWPSTFRRTVAAFARDAEKNYPAAASDAVRLLHWADVPPLPGSPVVTPLDLHTHNVIVDGDEIVGAIDFERCYRGHPGWSFAVTRHVLDPLRESPAVREAFDAGYADVAGDVPGRRPAFEVAALVREMRAGHMWWDEPDAHRSRLRELVGDVEAMLE